MGFKMAALSNGYNSALSGVQTQISQWIDCLPKEDRVKLLEKRTLTSDSQHLLQVFEKNNASLLLNLSKEVRSSEETKTLYSLMLNSGERSKDSKEKVAAAVLGFLVPLNVDGKFWNYNLETLMDSIRDEFQDSGEKLKPEDVAKRLIDGSIYNFESLKADNIQGGMQLSPAASVMRTIALDNKDTIKALREGLKDPQFRRQFNDHVDKLLKNKDTKAYAYILDHLVEGGAYIDAFISCSTM